MADAYLKVKDNGANGLAIVREESDVSVTDLKSALSGQKSAILSLSDNMSDNKQQTISLSDNGHYWNIETGVAVYTDLSGYYRASEAISVIPGEIYTVSGNVGTTHKARIWVLTDDDMNIIAMAEDYYIDAVKTDTFIVPVGATKLLITTNSGLTPSPYATLYKNVLYEVAKPEDITRLSNDIEILSNNIFEQSRQTNFELSHAGYFWNIETNVAVYTHLSQANWMASTVIPVQEGEIYIVSGDQGQTHKARIWAVTDDDMNIIAMAEDHYTTTEAIATETFVVPSDATKLVLTTRYNVGAPYVWLYKKQSALDILNTKILEGKKLSLLGDSISAYAGTIPVGYDAYYTGSNSGVNSPNQMWWKILCDKTGMIPLIINGYSGSGITQLEDSSHINKIPMSSDERCGGLGTESVNPDIVLIAGGVNDYTYALSAQSEPLQWDGKTAPVLSNSFTEAYACMIKKIQTNYPDAIIVALSTWFTMRGTDNGYVLTHTVGQNSYTQQDYNEKIRYVAEQMHIPYIDVSNIGFNRNNFYPTYAVDSSTIPTHPNAAGQAVMGKAIAEKLIELVAGYLA